MVGCSDQAVSALAGGALEPFGGPAGAADRYSLVFG
jgi:hypothetical protein